MVSSAGYALIGALGGAALTGGLSIAREYIRQRKENKRKKSELFLEYKVDVLTDLSSKVVECDQIISEYVMAESDTSDSSIDASSLEEAEEKVNELDAKWRQAHIYLDPENKQDILKALIYCRLCLDEIQRGEEQSFDWSNIDTQDAEIIPDNPTEDDFAKSITQAYVALYNEIVKPSEEIESESLREKLPKSPL